VMKRESMSALRKKKKELLLVSDEIVDGRKICSKCYRSKLLSEFSTNREDGSGRVNKLCDSCLTAVYASASRKTDGFCDIWWRQRAYSCNTAYRYLVAKQKNVPVSSVKLTDLDYVCKPQDLVPIFERQDRKCAYCRCPLVPDDTSVDHAIPKCRGGEHRPHNFRITCKDCNRLKWDRTEAEFHTFLISYLARFSSRTSG